MQDNITKVRRQNSLTLFRDWAQDRIAGGEASKGLEQAFAELIAVSPSMWSQIKSNRPIGDRLARQIEHHAGKSAGWLDEPHEGAEPPDSAEQYYLELAKIAWRSANAAGKRDLLRAIKAARPK